MKLAMHPVIWVFIFAFPFLALIPNYPTTITFFYICATYPILFLGANKGQQSNDIFYSCLLPIRKKDVIKARMLTMSFIQFVSLAITCALLPLGELITSSINTQATTKVVTPGFSCGQLGSLIGLILISFAIYDFIYLLLFYRNGRSVVLSTLCSMIVFAILVGIFGIALPAANVDYLNFFSKPIVQILSVIIGVVFYFGIRYLAYIFADKLFEKVDF